MWVCSLCFSAIQYNADIFRIKLIVISWADVRASEDFQIILHMKLRQCFWNLLVSRSKSNFNPTHTSRGQRYWILNPQSEFLHTHTSTCKLSYSAAKTMGDRKIECLSKGCDDQGLWGVLRLIQRPYCVKVWKTKLWGLEPSSVT